MMKLAILYALLGSVLVFCTPSFGHLAEIGTSGTPVEMDDWTVQSFEHEDADPWKGWAFVSPATRIYRMAYHR